MKLFKDQNIKTIFDVSGGASDNQILGYLDYEIIKKNNKLDTSVPLLPRKEI